MNNTQAGVDAARAEYQRTRAEFERARVAYMAAVLAARAPYHVRAFGQFQPMGIGLLPAKLTAREADNRRAYESHVLQTAIAAGVAISDSHTRTTYQRTEDKQ